MSIQPPLTPIRPKAAGAVGVKEAAEAAWSTASILPPEPVQPQPQPQALTSESAASSPSVEECGVAQAEGAMALQQPERQLDTDADASAMTDDTIAAGAAAVPLPPSPTNAAAVAASATAATPALASPAPMSFAAQPAGTVTVPASAAAASTAAPTPSPSRVPRRRTSLQSWPYYIIAAVEGSANASYAHFTPRRKTGARGGLYSMPAEEELPDPADIDWWGAGNDADEPQAPAAPSPADANVNSRPTESIAVSVERDDVTMSEAGAAAGRVSPPPQPSPPSQLSAGPTSPPSGLPSVDLVSSFGQDACFVISRPQLGCCVLGVADGVGGWSVHMRSSPGSHAQTVMAQPLCSRLLDLFFVCLCVCLFVLFSQA